MQKFIIENHNGIDVVRDDLLEGGSKSRFLLHLIKNQKEVVYGSPFCGGAAVCLSQIGKKNNIKITLFYAKRKKLHRNQIFSLKSGATLYQVPYGYMTNVQSKAKKYAKKNNALFLPLGFDVPKANKPFIEQMRWLRNKKGKYDEVWLSCGSGMLTRCIANAFYDAKIKSVVVGLKSKNSKQNFPSNVELLSCKYKFEQDCKSKPPFKSSENYDAKAWEKLMLSNYRNKRILFWNVL